MNEPQRKQIQRIRRLLLRWGREHFRSFPWRSDRDLYRSLVTEILLKQTTAARVVDVRRDLLERFPDPAALAAAGTGDLAAIIRSLGFVEQRSTQLVALGRALVEQPPTRTASSRLLELPGVGPYTAAAVACFAWGRAEPALDVNVARIVMRLFGIEVIKGEPRRSRVVNDLARELVTGRQPREMNWALLDLGAEVCRPAPVCHECPLAPICAHASSLSLIHKKRTNDLPTDGSRDQGNQHGASTSMTVPAAAVLPRIRSDPQSDG